MLMMMLMEQKDIPLIYVNCIYFLSLIGIGHRTKPIYSHFLFLLAPELLHSLLTRCLSASARIHFHILKVNFYVSLTEQLALIASSVVWLSLEVHCGWLTGTHLIFVLVGSREANNRERCWMFSLDGSRFLYIRKRWHIDITIRDFFSLYNIVVSYDQLVRYMIHCLFFKETMDTLLHGINEIKYTFST